MFIKNMVGLHFDETILVVYYICVLLLVLYFLICMFLIFTAYTNTPSLILVFPLSHFSSSPPVTFPLHIFFFFILFSFPSLPPIYIF